MSERKEFKYEIGRSLGEGQFGKVKEAVHLDTGHRYAVKIIKKCNIRSKKDVDTVKKEVTFMKQLNGHPNILNLFDVNEDAEKLFLILELATGGDLFDKIISEGGFAEEPARFYFRQIVDGLEHCHGMGVVHRDMKPENLLIGTNEVLKISDFGLSNIIMTPGQMLNTHCGSEKYAAPEVMQTTDPYLGPPVDIWSAGVVLYIMVGGAFPFVEATNKCDLYRSLVAGTFEFPAHFSPDLIDLLRQMFAIRPEDRPTIAEVKAHRWVHPELQTKPVAKPPIEPPAAEALAIDDNMVGEAMDGMGLGMDEEVHHTSGLGMDEEMVYRTLDPEMMSVETAGYDDLEPVYRACDLSEMEGDLSSPCRQGSGFACRPTSQFTTPIAPSELLGRLATDLQNRGAEVSVKEEKGQLKVEMQGQSGDVVKIKILCHEENGTTKCELKRMKGHSLDYCDMFTSFGPLFKGLGLECTQAR